MINIIFKKDKVCDKQQHRLINHWFKDTGATIELRFDTDRCAILYISEFRQEYAENILIKVLEIVNDHGEQIKCQINDDGFGCNF